MADCSYEDIFQRATLVLGQKTQDKLRSENIIIFGVGGVGSWCAEGLIRAGVEHLTIVDSDNVDTSNINRQRMATVLSIGQSKVEALKSELLKINPESKITALQKVFCAESAEEFKLEQYDYIVDAIDSLKDKAALILAATSAPGIFFSSMGAARKIDPTHIKVGNFWKVRDCPLGAALRKKLRRSGTLPEHSFQCVYGDEVTGEQKGSLVHITCIFGMTLSGLIIKDIHDKSAEKAD
ncbi:MAG TPA: tRNA threonylcarbamoyladenosine dehydratase [Rikenellaceae bacterium]|nr:tRNA threonylcarbamoyladenosine dehydratase [Rikenellaceae bacterium]